jgi:CDP-paratose 2-epimerase
LQNAPISIYGDGRQVRDVLCVEDLLRAFESVRAHRDKTAGEVYNVGGGLENAVSLFDLMKEIQYLSGKTLRYSFQPPRPGDQPVYVTDFSKLQAHTRWCPHLGVRDTLECIYDWWRQHRDVFAPPMASSDVPAALLQHFPEVAS